jgi:hypothetical protein
MGTFSDRVWQQGERGTISEGFSPITHGTYGETGKAGGQHPDLAGLNAGHELVAILPERHLEKSSGEFPFFEFSDLFDLRAFR